MFLFYAVFGILLVQQAFGQSNTRQCNTIEDKPCVFPFKFRDKTFFGCTIFSGKLISLCSRNFQNVKLRLDFVEIWSFYRHSDFTWNQIWVNSNGIRMSFLATSKPLNFEFLVNFGLESCSNLLKLKFRTSESTKNDIFWPFEFTKI